jgi:SulP family sulfate permease
VNLDAGAETPLAGAFTVAGILAATLFLTPLFQFLPQGVPAATITVVVLSLVDNAAIKRTWSYSKADFVAMVATILTVLLIGVRSGITAGVSLSLLLFLWRTSRPHNAINSPRIVSSDRLCYMVSCALESNWIGPRPKNQFYPS